MSHLVNRNIETIVLGGGCFWCTEAIFKMLKGVISVTPGYAGGDEIDSINYESVSTGKTGHAEVIKIEYNPDLVPLENLLTVFFGSHDPTTLNRQGADVGTQYRSIVLYSNEKQKEISESFAIDLNQFSQDGNPIVTEVKPLIKFHEAESYHKDYYKNNSQNQYCEIVINPKLQKVQKQFAQLINNK